MPQVGEAYSPPSNEPKPDDPEGKKGLTLRIHLLFDGTNNNKANIVEREKFELGEDSDSYNRFGNGLDTSYDNGRTNIATMESFIVEGKGVGGYNYVVKVYVQGQGTRAFEADSTKGLAFGSGLTGVYHRAREGITDALNTIYRDFLQKYTPDDYFIRQVDIDVFGFSRGAATARHAIHALTTSETITISDPNGYSSETIIVTHPFFERLKLLGYSETRADQVKIIFAGLYDTVVSVNASQLTPAWFANNTRDQRAVAKAKYALHLAAADEHRQDFPLHRIKSAISAGTGAEYYLPGVHSDIGGSYNLANQMLIDKGENYTEIRDLKAVGKYIDLRAQERDWRSKKYKTELEITEWLTTRAGMRVPRLGRLYVYRTLNKTEYVRTTNEVDRPINRGTMAELEADKANLISDGWYKEEQLTIESRAITTIARAMNIFGSADLEDIHSGVLIANRIGITSGYCNIPLKFMAEHARRQAIQIDEKLEQQANRVLEEVEEFKNLEACLRSYMAAKGPTGSKPEDWNNIREAVKYYPGIKELRNKHLHNSTRLDSSLYTGYSLDPGFTPRFEKGLRRRFYYEG